MKDDTTISLALLLMVFAFALVIGLAIGTNLGTSAANKDFVRQCSASQFYFTEGVGIQCPVVQDNRAKE